MNQSPDQAGSNNWILRTKDTPYETQGKQHPEGTTYHINHGIHELALFHRHPTDSEKDQFNNAPATMAIWNNPPALWIAVKFGYMNWIDAPFTVHLTHPEARDMPELKYPQDRFPLTMLFVNADGGTIEAIRVATMSPAMSRDIRRIVEEQKTSEYDSEKYNRSIRLVASNYSPMEIAGQAQRAEILGK